MVLDFYLGEPVPGESLAQAEQHVRLLAHSIKEPENNPWFVTVYHRRGSYVGVLATGAAYTVDSGADDLGSIAVLSHWETCDLDGGAPDRLKNWRRLRPTFRERGDWDVIKTTIIDLQESGSPVGVAVGFRQVVDNSVIWGSGTWGSGVWSGAGTVNSGSWDELYSFWIRHRFENNGAGEDWVLTAITQEYQIASIQD
jgi:hypothetical protein